jgi:hypothetical protein
MSGLIHDYHSPHNNRCPQNSPDTIEQDCNCEMKTKRSKRSEFLNRAFVKKMWLQATNSRQNLRVFSCVAPSALDAISALVKQEIIRRAENPPKTGKTLS